MCVGGGGGAVSYLDLQLITIETSKNYTETMYSKLFAQYKAWHVSKLSHPSSLLINLLTAAVEF